MFSWFRAGVIKEVAFKNVSPLLFFLFFFLLFLSLKQFWSIF